MTAALFALKLFAGNALGAAWRFIKHASFWQLVAIGLGALLIVQHFQLADARHDRDAWQKQAAGFKARLDSISTKRNVQHDVTERTVEKVVRGDPIVKTVVKTIRDAPNPPDCKTPGLEAARNAL